MKLARPAVPLIIVVAALAIVAGAAALRAQNPQPDSPQQPIFRTGVNAVRVDVVITDHDGNPVTDLEAADFELTEDGKPQPIDSARLIRVQTRQEPGGEAPREIRTFDDEATELARDDIRIIVLFLDDYHVSRMSAMRLREWLVRFVNDQIGPYDVVAVMYPLLPTAALAFTRDKFVLGTIIGKFEGRRGEYMPRNDAEAGYAMESPWRIEAIRNEVVLSALKSVCYRLGSLNEGRKSVIIVAETLGGTPSDLREVIDAANRNNVAIYPLQVQGIGMGGFGLAGILRELADNTNGRAIVNRNDLDAAFETVLRDSSAYYLLGYTSQKGPDGKFHEIDVKVKRPGLEVRARKGYWAPTPQEAAKAAAPSRPAPTPAVTSALGALAEPRGRLIRTWVGFSPGDNGQTHVTFVWEPAPMPGAAPSERPARVDLVASANGRTCFEGTAGAGAQAGDGSAAVKTGTGAPRRAWRAVFDAPPGKLQMKLTIMSAASSASPDVLQHDTQEIVVPDFRGRPIALSTAAVFSALTPREFRALAADPQATPVATRRFSRVERLQIRFEAHTQPPATPSFTVRLLNSNGDPMASLTPQPLDAKPGQEMIDLPLANLPRGDYVIEIAARSGTAEAKEMVGFRVTG